MGYATFNTINRSKNARIFTQVLLTHSIRSCRWNLVNSLQFYADSFNNVLGYLQKRDW